MALQSTYNNGVCLAAMASDRPGKRLRDHRRHDGKQDIRLSDNIGRIAGILDTRRHCETRGMAAAALERSNHTITVLRQNAAHGTAHVAGSNNRNGVEGHNSIPGIETDKIMDEAIDYAKIASISLPGLKL